MKLGMLKLTSNILEEIKSDQKEDLELVDRVVLVNQGKGADFRLDQNGVLMFRDRVCVPDVPELKKHILDEGHQSSLSIHPRAWNEEGYSRVCVCLFSLSEVED